jgi:hypothetical protein
VALTEVLKIVAEDRASATLARVSLNAQRSFGLSKAGADRFSKALSGYVTESVVGFGRTAALSFVAMSATATAAIAAITYKLVEHRLEYDKMVRAYSGQSSPLLGSVDNLNASFDRLQGVLADIVVQSLNLPDNINAAANAAERLSKSLTADSLKTAFSNLVGLAPVLSAFGAGGGLVGGALSFLGQGSAAGKKLLDGAPPPDDGVRRMPPVHIKVRTPEEIDKANAAAAARAISFEQEGIKAQREAEQAIAAEAERLFQESEKQKDQQDAMRLARLNRETEERRAQMQVEAELTKKQAEDKKFFAEQDRIAVEEQKRAAQELANVYANVGSQIGGLFNAIIRGGMSAEDVMLKLIGTALSLASSIFLPGAGAAASGIFGFLGSIFGFQDGGVMRAANGMRVPGVGAGDRVPALLEPGETVIPKNGTHPSFIDEVARAGGGGGGNITVNLSQSYLVPPDSVTAQRNYQRGLVPELASLQATGRASVSNPRIRGSGAGRKRG